MRLTKFYASLLVMLYHDAPKALTNAAHVLSVLVAHKYNRFLVSILDCIKGTGTRKAAGEGTVDKIKSMYFTFASQLHFSTLQCVQFSNYIVPKVLSVNLCLICE